MIRDSFTLPQLPPPARLNAEQVAQYLGFQEHDIPVLVSAGLLNPLGNPVQNSTKYFHRKEIERLGDDKNWLHRATKVVATHWAKQNARRKSVHEENEHAEKMAA
jgi:hypothetical protein